VDIFDEHILTFWKALQEYEVQYILVGGYAVNFHGYQRFTGDMDLWLKDASANRVALRKPFAKCDVGDFPMIEQESSKSAQRSN
jgi:hypothetical protein